MHAYSCIFYTYFWLLVLFSAQSHLLLANIDIFLLIYVFFTNTIYKENIIYVLITIRAIYVFKKIFLYECKIVKRCINKRFKRYLRTKLQF